MFHSRGLVESGKFPLYYVVYLVASNALTDNFSVFVDPYIWSSGETRLDEFGNHGNIKVYKSIVLMKNQQLVKLNKKNINSY